MMPKHKPKVNFSSDAIIGHRAVGHLLGPSNDHLQAHGEACTAALPGLPPAHPVSTCKYKGDVGDSYGAMCTRATWEKTNEQIRSWSSLRMMLVGNSRSRLHEQNSHFERDLSGTASLRDSPNRRQVPLGWRLLWRYLHPSRLPTGLAEAERTMRMPKSYSPKVVLYPKGGCCTSCHDMTTFDPSPLQKMLHVGCIERNGNLDPIFFVTEVKMRIVALVPEKLFPGDIWSIFPRTVLQATHTFTSPFALSVRAQNAELKNR